MSTASAVEFACRVRCRNTRVRLDTQTAKRFLEDWEARGIALEEEPGRWALTPAGRAMFAGWAHEFDRDREVST